ncbi:HNH endonuclease [Massilia sp. UMI-21]|nr:HNH endonuclease [Massilia sp. UMI-21]
MAWGTKSRHERGYDSAWVKVRNEVMRRDCGLCQPCQRAGRLGTNAHAVDHIVSKAKASRLGWLRAKTDHPSNLEAICESCHSVKTEVEQGKRKRPRKTVGEDGWPV